MKIHTSLNDELLDKIILYSLNALDRAEVAEFEEHLEGGCDLCRCELRAFQKVTDHLSYSAPLSSPGPQLREELFAHIQKQRPDKTLLYALGILETEERSELEEHLSQGCSACESEVRNFRSVTNELSYAVWPSSPPAHLRQRLLDRVSAQSAEIASVKPPPKTTLRRSSEVEWQRVSTEGVWVKILQVAPDKTLSTRLVRMQPGAKLPPHRHPAIEEFLILEGYGEVEGQILGPGDYHRAAAGSIHGPSNSEEGCIYICFAALQYEIVAEEMLPDDSEKFWTIGSTSGVWENRDEIVAVKTLFGSGSGPFTTALMRVSPSRKSSFVGDLQAKEIYVLHGQVQFDTLAASSDDYLYTQSGFFSKTLQSETGCLLLLHS